VEPEIRWTQTAWSSSPSTSVPGGLRELQNTEHAASSHRIEDNGVSTSQR